MIAMDAQLISSIEDLGLSNKEARIYVASLMVGPSGVQAIADYSGIKRVTTYVILESLVSLGLVSQSVKGKKTLFIAEDPTNLRRLLDKREQEVKDQKQSFETILPELLSLKSLPKDSTNVKFFEGAEGIKTIMDTYLNRTDLKDDKLIYGFSNLDHVFHYFPDIKADRSNPRRVSQNIRSRFLYTSSEGPIMRAGDEAANRESRYLPLDKFAMMGDFTIIGDMIVMLSLTGEHPLGVMIKSDVLAKGLCVMFEAAWEAAEKYN
jgi:sugar-specific transcriptional regulator TrmB